MQTQLDCRYIAKKTVYFGLATAAALVALCAVSATDALAASPLVIKEQGARPFAGTQIGDPAKASISCDHGYVEWQIPQRPRKLPILMVHASSTKTWDTTFDGREGFRNIFLRRGYAVYLTDLPRTGRAGQACKSTTYVPRVNNDQASLTTWRIGLWLPGMSAPDFYPGVQFAVNNKKALDEFFRIQYPEFNDAENENLESDALKTLLQEIGPSIMLTHSSTGIRGWITGTKSSNVAAIISYEPGTAVFPDTEMPPDIVRADGSKVPAGNPIPMEAFLKLTKIPIQIVWGDYIPTEMKAENVGPRLTLDNRRANVMKSKLMVDAINRHGGNAQVVMLPEIGVKGNTHFPMLDLNNVKIADLLSKYLKDKGLDRQK
ncbi:MAG: alpha/beta hydrolase [Betaproteobacteria bacterium]|nr:alpha/beta hydrolase [Betaproteobacteria bacterium]